MPTVGSFSGKLVRLLRGNADGPPETFTAIACLTANSINIAVNALQQACKDSGGWSEGAPDEKSATVEAELLIKYDATTGVDELWTDLSGDVVSNYKMSTSVTGDPEWSFAAFISSYTENFTIGEFASASVTLTIVGAPTRAAIA